MRLVLRASGPAPVATAWERYADLSAWPTWSPQISAVEVAGPLRLRRGMAGRVLGLPVRGRPVLAVDFVVEHLDERAMTWAWAVEARRALLPVPRTLGRWARMRLVHAVRERAPRGAAAAVGSTTTLEVSGVAPAVLGYALPAWVALRLLVR